MADGFDIVAVGIEKQGAIVVWMIVLTQAWRAVIPASRGERCFMERVN